MNPSSMGDHIFTSNNWKKLSKATDQKVLSKAQEKANLGMAVIAMDYPFKHLAITVEGDLVKSGGWGLDCPNAISLFQNRPSKSFIGKPISYSWAKPEEVEIWFRKY